MWGTKYHKPVQVYIGNQFDRRRHPLSFVSWLLRLEEETMEGRISAAVDPIRECR